MGEHEPGWANEHGWSACVAAWAMTQTEFAMNPVGEMPDNTFAEHLVIWREPKTHERGAK
jgi:hypothetical protein